ncbi:hypothetical protein J2X68_007537 [Streptomyces sp. 3330]|uniref:hypothetical protein n=1 Tax=Streptomyces sp. 3330 TaxID=2817755 RepID=UPI00285EBEF1|nr:hypothetical protein [Streptomyces sp. 3330]MDR6980795.1 hypothetical protein [Streptomyces sp. 3330]
MEAALRVAPVAGETTWSFLHRVAAAYRMQAGDLCRTPATTRSRGRHGPPYRNGQTGATADVARRLLRGLGHSAGLIEAAWKQTVVAAVIGGVPLEEVARCMDMPVEVLSQMLTAGRRENDG